MSTQAAPSPTSTARHPANRRRARTTSYNPVKFVERKLFELKRNVWATYSLGMLEPWEIVLVVTVVSVVSALLWYSLFYHFPTHFRKVVRRAIYYIYGYTPTANEPISSTLAQGPPPAAAAAVAGVYDAAKGAVTTAAHTAASATAGGKVEL
ncbi:uncharacterized protein PFL1_04977 [Pseudozyma flocculosa PF-1]|uniref:Uncharacterized protein n=2 Tax=Pseudozyma flocculosa TaxID=84751 RepID=A0A5C3EVR5_9BASI|nr:uncharacterized protein PFL1_04977 [Pseudozyma flocculosa PF-1]EPQ27439.1 hypothetical protein PFL1_04977 [Pseudozyma flocculosa PF-1]SPO36132.1 uncharacterized protein PSFLO_01603 [Pseudozyma flocculosa]